jgi:hypothetical protein
MTLKFAQPDPHNGNGAPAKTATRRPEALLPLKGRVSGPRLSSVTRSPNLCRSRERKHPTQLPSLRVPPYAWQGLSGDDDPLAEGSPGQGEYDKRVPEEVFVARKILSALFGMA